MPHALVLSDLLTCKLFYPVKLQAKMLLVTWPMIDRDVALVAPRFLEEQRMQRPPAREDFGGKFNHQNKYNADQKSIPLSLRSKSSRQGCWLGSCECLCQILQTRIVTHFQSLKSWLPIIATFLTYYTCLGQHSQLVTMRKLVHQNTTTMHIYVGRLKDG